MEDHRRVMTSNGDPLGTILKTKRDRKRLAKYQDPMMPLGMPSYISPPGHRVAYFIAPPSHPEEKSPTQGASREVPSKSNQRMHRRRIRNRAN